MRARNITFIEARFKAPAARSRFKTTANFTEGHEGNEEKKLDRIKTGGWFKAALRRSKRLRRVQGSRFKTTANFTEGNEGNEEKKKMLSVIWFFAFSR
jgi:hypothetical protein